MSEAIPTLTQNTQKVRHPLHEVWTQAWPIIITMTSYTVMQFVDKLMVGQVGPLELAAQGNGGIWAFTPLAFAMGALVVVNTWVSQHMGAGHPERVARYLWGALYLTVGIWFAVLLPWSLLLPWFFTNVVHSTHSVEQLDSLIALEVGYGQILLWGGIFQLAGRGIHQFFFGIMRPKVVTVAVIIGNIVNVGMSYILIFGEAGLSLSFIELPGVPGGTAMGVHGAAIGTVCGLCTEAVIPFIVFLGPRCQREFGSRSAWRPHGESIRELIRLGWPGSLVSGNEIVCWSVFMTMLVGLFGNDSMTAGWIVLGYMHLAFMPAVAISFAINTLVGNSIGSGNKDLAVQRTRWGVGLGVVYMTLCGLSFALFSESMVSIFIGSDVSPEQAESILDIGVKMMLVAALFQTVDAFGICYSGALRGAGDVVWPGLFMAACGWTFIVGVGWMLATEAPQLGAIGPWIGAAIYIIVSGVGLIWRFESGRWRTIKLITDTKK
jgi:MATE family multidrug resistance protein